MNRSSGARLCATVAVGALSLALVTGCAQSGPDDSEGSGSASTAPAASAAPAAKARGAAELKKLIIAQGDVEGYEVEADDSRLPGSKDEVQVDKAECEPLAHVMSGLAPGESAGEARTVATEQKSPSDTASASVGELSEGEFEDAFTDALSIDMTVVGLSSYDGDGTARTFDSVSDAIAGCAGGFTLTAQGADQKITKVATEKASGTGDESVAFSATVAMEDQEAPGTVHGEVVRHGGTLATYYTINMGALISGEAYDIPAAVIDAQAAGLK
ncbi:hypothetical protein [Streptomyces chromofuscus]|uniref:Lipoprotein n=1 Tax=Streptomyces chromofuscus TaxID=42881 RepID=A0A7M2T2X4_STRCW|nr:hypothetical protein [Streptomyces chromofuscus]QOV42624.1 hypothetical protein IPT68_22775 [Streptomyces chromofuscus]GGS89466.1 lipoprotein [Streptomyces chromofuscus]